MRTFDYSKLNLTLDNEIIGYIAKIHEYKGRQQLFISQKKEKLEKLVEIAKVQSTESSNKIEGIVSTNTRIKQLVLDKTTPKNRDEKEIMGYRDVLNIIHENYEYIPITPNYILQLHKYLYQYSNPDFGGKFKNSQNYIVANLPDGSSKVLFEPLSPVETPIAMEQLCETFNKAMNMGEVDSLLLIITFIKDFLCIHPFNDGNGRMSRLLTTLLLYRSGFVVCKYISLEKKIEKTKDTYYDVLEESSENWQDGANDNTPFVKYILGIVLSAYRDFEERLNLIENKVSSYEMVEHAVINQLGKFTKSDIQEYCPTLARQTIEKALKQLCEEGKIEKHGQSNKTFYVRKTI
ncbi:MAG: Fic family protein [Sphaerochaetaceae bacterium]|nr:Fic family protein [Sphaerochaetaceae bacterium]